MIIVSAHFGRPRLIKPALRLQGYNAQLVGMMTTTRGFPECFTEDLPTTPNLRPHLAALKRNELLIILMDGRAALSLRSVSVLGIEIPFATGAMRLARAVGAPVLPAFLVDDGTLREPLAGRLIIHPPLELQATDDRELDLVENIHRFSEIYAKAITAHPHNLYWGWVRKAQFNGPADQP